MTVGSDFPETADIETSSEDYAQRFAGEIGAWFLQVQEEATLCMLEPFPATTILDVGGGHGQLTPALIQQGYHVTVLGSAASCQRRIKSLLDNQRCTFEVGNILDLPYPDQAFDVVVSYRLLPHVTAWQRCIAELTRVARRVVLVDYPAVCSVNYIAPLLFQAKKRLEGNTRTFTSFKERELLAVFQACGFQRAERYPEFFFPMVLHRFMQAPRLSATLEQMCRLIGLTDIFGSPVIMKLVRKGK
jgi:2-polyprenyl-3-methyl-5-hydroxy-6-metoxy-1,4-benzoquinol methylase